MKKTIHIACSLDGFIADSENRIAWLENLSTNPEVGSRIGPFIEKADGVVMGRATYETCLAFEQWPYPDKVTLVVTSSDGPPTTPSTYFLKSDAILEKAESLGIQNLWIVGGGMLNGYMVERGWVDELYVTIAPIVLGNGRSLMASLPIATKLIFQEMHALPDGFVELSYRFR